jgi:hypothetical protein
MIRIAVFALVCVACSPGAPDEELLDDAEASSSVESMLGKVAATFVGGDASGDMSIAAPSDTCVATAPSTAIAQETTYHFADCAGPYGLADVSGDVVVDWMSAGPTFHIDVTSSNLAIGKASITSWTASADVTAQGAQRTMIWQSTASGTVMVRGSPRAFERTIDATSTWTIGDPCIDIDGQAQGTIEKSNGTILHVDTRASAFVACASSCPNSGSELRADDVDDPGTFVQVLYGSSTATYTNDRGQTFTFTPACATPE